MAGVATLSRRSKLKRTRRNRPNRRPSQGPGFFGFMGRIFKNTLLVVLCLGLLAGLGLGLLVGHRWITTHPYFAVEEISVSGNQRLTYGEIVSESGIALGDSSLEANVGEARARLAANPWIKTVAVKRTLPGDISISIIEREPMFWALGADGKLMYANDKGEPFAPVEPGKFASLPVLDMDADAARASGVLDALVFKARTGALPFSLAQTAWVSITDHSGVVVNLDKQKLTLKMSLTDFEQDLARLCAAWRDLKKRGEMKRIRSLTAMDGRVWAAR